MAVWCLVTWCHTGQSYGSRRRARVREQDAMDYVRHLSENKDKKASIFFSTGEFTSPRSHLRTWMVLIRWKTGMDKSETLTWRSTVSSHIWLSIQRCYNTLMNTLKPNRLLDRNFVWKWHHWHMMGAPCFHFCQRRFWQLSKHHPPHVCPGGTSEPAASLPCQTHSGWSKDESICQNDPLSGVLGSSKALCQPAPQRQHD